MSMSGEEVRFQAQAVQKEEALEALVALGMLLLEEGAVQQSALSPGSRMQS